MLCRAAACMSRSGTATFTALRQHLWPGSRIFPGGHQRASSDEQSVTGAGGGCSSMTSRLSENCTSRAIAPRRIQSPRIWAMTSDEEKDPPVPSYLEGISLKRVHDDQGAEEHDTNDIDSLAVQRPERINSFPAAASIPPRASRSAKRRL